MSKKYGFYFLLISTFILLLVAYSKHFDNEFHFDDAHTIQNNSFVRDIKNIPDFFVKGAETFSSLPQNQLYRPIVTSSLAIDYWLSEKFSHNGSGYNTFFYHLSMFIEYLILLVFMYFFIVKIFDITKRTSWNKLAALFTVAFFGLHTVNAETINYIISRSDLLSTLFVLIAFVIYQYFPLNRKYGLFLIPVILGMLTKLTAAMFFPLLLFYFIFFEADVFFDKFKSKKEAIKKLLIWLAPLLFVMLAGIYFVISMQADTYTTGGGSRWDYFITQFWVLFHYFISFFIPYNLSADTDMGLISMFSFKFFIGLVFILSMLFVVYKSYTNKPLRPIGFGILWFFISLAPTSSFIALAEVMNDHRMFYPFIGLSLAFIWLLSLGFHRFNHNILNNFYLKNIVVVSLALILFAHTYGVRKRVAVWDNGKSLWYDVTIKSPKNGRGLMNYGTKLMNEGDYNAALEYFNKALKYSPYYSYLYTNIAIVNNALGEYEGAEKNHKHAISLSPNIYNAYYYYAGFLKEHNRKKEAVDNYLIAIKIAPHFSYSYYGLLEIYNDLGNFDKLTYYAEKLLENIPDDVTAKYYLNLVNSNQSEMNKPQGEGEVSKLIEQSLFYYEDSDFEKVIEISLDIIKIDSDNYIAYNNMCAAYNKLQMWDLAIKSAKKSLSINPDNQLAQNNLVIAEKRKQLDNAEIDLLSYNELISLGLIYYNEEMFKSSVKVFLKAIEIDPDNILAYNNLCATYNALKEFEQAIIYGEIAIKLDPKNELARNNLNYSYKMIAE